MGRVLDRSSVIRAEQASQAPHAGPAAHALAALTVVVLVLGAVLADLGNIHTLEDGDSVLPVLVSLQRWTPMYWGQERFGMLVPLLALPFRDPLANLLVQRGLMELAGVAAVLLLARYALPRRSWLQTGLLGVAALILLMPAYWKFLILGCEPYCLSLTLTLTALLALDRPGAAARSRLGTRSRFAAAAALSVLGHWVNAGIGIFLAPLALSRAVLVRLEGGTWRLVLRRLLGELGLLGLGLASAQATVRIYVLLGRSQMDIGGLWPVRAWPQHLRGVFDMNLRGAGAQWMIAAGIAAVVGLLLPWRRQEGETGTSPRLGALRRAAGLLVAALVYVVFIAALKWVAGNAYHWRYISPSVILALLLGLWLLAEPVCRLPRGGPLLLALALLLVPAAALRSYGPPSLARVERDLDAKAGARTVDVLAARCDLVAGEYWSVWPTVWHTAWVAHRRGEPSPYGLSLRSMETAPFWRSRPREQLRICAIRGEEQEVNRWLPVFALQPVQVVDERGTVQVLVPAPAP